MSADLVPSAAGVLPEVLALIEKAKASSDRPAGVVPTDEDLIEWFLRERCHRSANTANNYRGQLRRVGWFCRAGGLSSIRLMTRELWPAFQAYLRNPPAAHIMPKSVGFKHAGWRPFRGKLGEASATRAEIIVKLYFAWMAEPSIRAIPFNPFSTISVKEDSKSDTRDGIERILTDEQMALVDQAIADMPQDNDEQRLKRARARWITSLAMKTGLRASEIARATSDMLQNSRLKGEVNLHITRKGRKQSRLPLLPEVMQAYRDYLRECHVPLDNTQPLPLVMTVRLVRGRLDSIPKPMTRAHIWRILKDVFLAAAELAEEAGDLGSAQTLKAASTHWLRHGFATSLVENGASLKSVQTLLDHGSIQTSSRYMHKPEEALRADLGRIEGKPGKD